MQALQCHILLSLTWTCLCTLKKKWLRLYIFLCSSTLRMKVDTVILNYTFGPEGQILSGLRSSAKRLLYTFY